jgi:hypothetical protein
MAQAGGDRRLAQEAPPEAIVARQFVGKHLQRDPLAPLLLLGQVDGATGPRAGELDDAVTREDGADGQLPAHGMSLAQVQVSRALTLARPGIEPATPRSSDRRTEHSNSRGKPCNIAGTRDAAMGTRSPQIAYESRPD